MVFGVLETSMKREIGVLIGKLALAFLVYEYPSIALEHLYIMVAGEDI
jgi:hypothetical protein